MIEYKVTVDNVGDKRWYLNGKLHREDGPAIEYANGNKCWYRKGMLHREDGPAVEFANGDKRWYRNGKFHREDGPAMEFVNGTKRWYINNVRVTEEEYNAKMNAKKSCAGKIVEIDGKKYKLEEVK